MTRALAVVLVLVGCGARVSPRPAIPRGETPSEVAGVTVIARSRAGEGQLGVALFVRVRSTPAALATVAALVLEERSAGRLIARATSDGVALRATAASQELGSVVDALAAALASRDAMPDEVERARARLLARRAGRATDDRGRAARLAVSALFGAALDPLGSANEDDRLTSDAVSQLLRSDFGVERSLVVCVGDVAPDDVDRNVARAFADAPHVAPAEGGVMELARDVRVEVSDHDIVGVARRVESLAAARRARAWVAWADPSATVTAFPLHGAAVLVAVRDGRAEDIRPTVERMLRAVRLDEHAATDPAPDVEEEILGLGDAWLADGDIVRGVGLGVGVVVRGDDGNAETDEIRAEALRSQLRASLEEPTTPEAASLDESTADLYLASGARVRVRRIAGGSLAVAIAFDGGASLDPAREHGRAALFAALLAQSCEPDAEGSWVDARSLGVVLTGDPGTLEITIARAVDCVRNAHRFAAHTEALRADAIARLDDAARERAWAAGAISPGAPGLVAPSGSASGLAGASGLDTALRAMLAAERATIVVIGDVEPARVVRIVDALAGELVGAGEALVRAPSRVAPGDVFVTDPIVEAPQVIVTLRSDAGESVAAARATARALAGALESEGAAVQFWFGDAALGASFVAVGVRGSDAFLDALPARMSERLAQLDPSANLGEALATDVRRRALASPMDLARSWAADVEPSDPLAVARSLLLATPRYVMLRASAGPMRPLRPR